GKTRQNAGEEVDQLARVAVEFARIRPGADVRVQRDDLQASGRSHRARVRQNGIFVPDAVLRRGTAGIAGLDVSVAEAGIRAHRDRAAVAGGRKLGDLPGRADVGHDSVTEYDLERVVAVHVGGKHDNRRIRAEGKSRSGGAQNFVAADGVDPQARFTDDLQDGARRVRLHRIAHDQIRMAGHGGKASERGTQDIGVVEVERRAYAGCDAFERIRVEIHGKQES